MRLQSLVHLAQVAAAIAPGRQIVILGSSSLLGSFPDLGETAGPVESSRDADLLVEGIDQELAGVLQESIGKGSLFAIREGNFVDAMRPVVAETLPRGWKDRLVPLPGCEAAWCLDPHDLAVAKLQAGRPKDLALCAALLSRHRLDARLIEQRLIEARVSDRMLVLAGQHLRQAVTMAQTPEDIR